MYIHFPTWIFHELLGGKMVLLFFFFLISKQTQRSLAQLHITGQTARAGTRPQITRAPIPNHTHLAPGETDVQIHTHAFKKEKKRKKNSKQIQCLPRENLNKEWWYIHNQIITRLLTKFIYTYWTGEMVMNYCEKSKMQAMHIIMVSFLKQCSPKLLLYFDHTHDLVIYTLYKYGEMIGSIYTRLHF